MPRQLSDSEVAGYQIRTEAQWEEARIFVRTAKVLYDAHVLPQWGRKYLYWPILDELRSGIRVQSREVRERVIRRKAWGDEMRFTPDVGYAGTDLIRKGLMRKKGGKWELTGEGRDILMEMNTGEADGDGASQLSDSATARLDRPDEDSSHQKSRWFYAWLLTALLFLWCIGS